MNLNKLVLDKIKSLGATKAAAYFGVSVPTIYAWKQKKNPPIAAVQKIIDDGHLDSGLTKVKGKGPAVCIDALRDAKVVHEVEPLKHSGPSQQLISFMAKVDVQIKHIDEGLRAITNAILRGDARELRFWAMKSTDPDAHIPITSGIAPFKNAESGMVVKSAAEILGDTPQPTNMPKNDDWNKPEGEVTPAGNRAPDWNAKVNPTDDKNRSADWNRELDPASK